MVFEYRTRTQTRQRAGADHRKPSVHHVRALGKGRTKSGSLDFWKRLAEAGIVPSKLAFKNRRPNKVGISKQIIEKGIKRTHNGECPDFDFVTGSEFKYYMKCIKVDNDDNWYTNRDAEHEVDEKLKNEEREAWDVEKHTFKTI